MTIYAIGDVQGCYKKLLELLDKIKFTESDTLWFVGDLVNRGTQSLETLRFIKKLAEQKRAITVLGNHDLGVLAIARGAYPYDPNHHTFQDILEAPDREELLSWLEQQPLLHHDPVLNFTLVHAGIYPLWDLKHAQRFAVEVERVLKGETEHRDQFYKHLFGNTPASWMQGLRGFSRLRFIVNAFTRMRFVREDGRQLNLTIKEFAAKPPEGYLPWFEIPNRKTKDLQIIFGHWAALNGNCSAANTYALDTGCVWGNSLTALKLDTKEKISVSCLKS